MLLWLVSDEKEKSHEIPSKLLSSLSLSRRAIFKRKEMQQNKKEIKMFHYRRQRLDCDCELRPISPGLVASERLFEMKIILN